MPVRDIIPWRRREESEGLAPRDLFSTGFTDLQREMNRLFDGFMGDFSLGLPMEGVSRFMPSVDVTETDKAIEVKADLPGMDEKDIEVTLDDDSLVLKGERKYENEEKTEGSHRIERSYGSFFRRIPLPGEVKSDKVEASFKKGVLHVTLPKAEASRSKGVKIKLK